MKTALVQLCILIAIAAGVVAAGAGPTRAHFGPAGEQAMWSAVAIVLAAGVVASVALAIVLQRHPQYAANAILAATTLRLLTTVLLAGALQLLQRDLALNVFLGWLLGLYLLFLAIETALGVVMLRRSTPLARTGG